MEIANRDGVIKAVAVACSLSIHSFRERTGAQVSNGSFKSVWRAAASVTIAKSHTHCCSLYQL
ncbi:MAG: hypothetical protein ACREBD_08640, partial [Blastocatellia bacterium]